MQGMHAGNQWIGRGGGIIRSGVRGAGHGSSVDQDLQNGTLLAVARDDNY